MKLYYSKGACSLVIRIVINELQLPAEYEAVDLKEKRTEMGQDYLKINPKGSVPALMTDKNILLTENLVIQQFLCDQNNPNTLLPTIGDIERYKVLAWSNFITTDIHKGFSPLFNPKIPQEIKDNIFIPFLKSKFSFIDEHMKSYIYGEEFTLPDAYFYVMLMWAQKFKMDLSEYEHLKKYFENLSQRPSIVNSLRAEGLGE